jgi:hypothetical protein
LYTFHQILFFLSFFLSPSILHRCVLSSWCIYADGTTLSCFLQHMK